jgi:EmrB/QacA subfamily drug resistance transporter
VSALHEHTTDEELTCVAGELHPKAVLAALVVGTILAPLDSSIVNIALPSIAAHFGERLSAVGWVTTAYLLTTASLLLSMGRLGDVWGLRRLYVAGLLIFGLGSFSSALSPSLAWLIASRVFQAVGSSMLFAAGPALVTRAFPPEKRGWALGYIALAVSLGLTAGPALGGFMVGTFGWPSIFVINIPLSVIVAAISWRLLPDECPDAQPFDAPGAVLAAAALLAILFGMGEADRSGFLSVDVLAPLAAGVVLALVFVWWERRTTSPMVDLALFRIRAFSAGIGAATLAYLALFSVTFTMPFYLTRIQGFDTRFAGLLLTTTPLVMALVAPAAGRLSDRKGSRALATAGISLLAAGLAGGSLLRAGGPPSAVVATLLAVGAGMAMFQTPNTASVLRATPRTRAGVGSAFVAEARNVGMALGVALAAALVGGAVGGAGLPVVDGAMPPDVAAAFMRGMARALRAGAIIAALGAALSWFGRESDAVEARNPNL